MDAVKEGYAVVIGYRERNQSLHFFLPIYMSIAHRGISPLIEVTLASMSTLDQPFTDGLTMARPGLDNRIYATGESLKGKAIYFHTGQWAGRVIRAELHELQHAELGRK